MALLWTVCDKNEVGAVVLDNGSAFIKKEYSKEQTQAFEKISETLCYFTEQHIDWRGSSYGDKVAVNEDEEEIPVTDGVVQDGKLIGFCPLRSPWDIENHKKKFYICLADREDKLTYHDPYPLFDEKKDGESWDTYTLISIIPREESECFNC